MIDPDIMDTPEPVTLHGMLRPFRFEGGIHLISGTSRAFGGIDAGEQDYAAQFQVGDDYIADERRGLLAMLDKVGADRSGPALEIGCGTGIFSRALARSGAYPEYLITDASLEFVRRTRNYVLHPFEGLPPLDEAQVRYGLLLEDGLDLLPGHGFSLVALRYVLHHILDWQGFIGATARLLRPGGVLTFEEPCVEGFLFQAALASFLPRLVEMDATVGTRNGLDSRIRNVKRALGIRDKAAMDRESQLRAQVQRFVETIEFYTRSDLDKSHAEDKHLFRVSDVMRAGRAHGLQVDFFPNAGYDTLARAKPANDFEFEFFHNLRTNFGFGEGIVDIARKELAPQLALLRRVSDGGGGPFTKGVFACKRV